MTDFLPDFLPNVVVAAAGETFYYNTAVNKVVLSSYSVDYAATAVSDCCYYC